MAVMGKNSRFLVMLRTMRSLASMILHFFTPLESYNLRRALRSLAGLNVNAYHIRPQNLSTQGFRIPERDPPVLMA